MHAVYLQRHTLLIYHTQCVCVEVFSQFTDEEFDAKTHATRIIQSHAISQQLAKLAEGINLLDRQLHSQVHGHRWCF